ncbi:MAG: DM13 domain-containing protein [Pseudomonadota bacterium]
MFKWIFLAGSHAAMLAVGFALGIYFLPILTAPEGPDKAMLAATAKAAVYNGTLTRDLKGSDFLHWGEGKISVTPKKIVHEGNLAPGPDYRLYLTTAFVEDEEQFLKLKDSARQVGDIKTFDGFIVELPGDVDVEKFNTVVVWCESFSEFITAVKYK